MRRGARGCASTVRRSGIQPACKNPRVNLLQVENNNVIEREVEKMNGMAVVSEAARVKEEEVESLEVSIHAISGYPSTTTMRWMGVLLPLSQ